MPHDKILDFSKLRTFDGTLLKLYCKEYINSNQQVTDFLEIFYYINFLSLVNKQGEKVKSHTEKLTGILASFNTTSFYVCVSRVSKEVGQDLGLSGPKYPWHPRKYPWHQIQRVQVVGHTPVSEVIEG